MKIGVKVLKPFSYRGKMRKVGETFGMPEKLANAMLLLDKVERYIKKPKEEEKPKRTYNTRRATATKKATISAEEVRNVAEKADNKDDEKAVNE